MHPQAYPQPRPRPRQIVQRAIRKEQPCPPRRLSALGYTVGSTALCGGIGVLIALLGAW